MGAQKRLYLVDCLPRSEGGEEVSVYIDSYNASFGRMTMCHMMADSTEELLAMADKIGVQRKWLQKAGTWREHFDVCKSKKTLAIANGAKEVSSRELMMQMFEKRGKR